MGFDRRATLTLALAALHGSCRGAVALAEQDVATVASWVPLRCPLHLLTGWRCPTCGLGRALVATFAGRWSEGWGLHPLGPIAVVAVTTYVVGIWTSRDATERAVTSAAAWLRARPRLMSAAVAAYVVVGLARNLP